MCVYVCSCSPEAIQRTFEVNTISHFWTVKAFLPDMISKDHGHIVTISSASAFIGVPVRAAALVLMCTYIWNCYVS